VSGITADLVTLDPLSGRYFQNTQSFEEFNRIFSGPNTAIAMAIIPAAFYAVGLLRRDPYAQKTFLLAGEAVLSSEILTTVMKDTTRRLNPGDVPENGDFSATWFKKTHGSWSRGIGSFPSGHTIAAFSIATVFAKRYPHPRWVP
jgi:membrane-associated phospholipid phosphatase